jgi:hypothetical protein
MLFRLRSLTVSSYPIGLNKDCNNNPLFPPAKKSVGKELCGSLWFSVLLCVSVVRVLLRHFTTESERGTQAAQRRCLFPRDWEAGESIKPAA